MIRLMQRLQRIKYHKTIYQALKITLKIKYEKKVTEIENRIHFTTTAVTETSFNPKVTEIF